MALDTLSPHSEATANGSCVTIGTFDGVHRGHQSLLQRVASRAEECGMASVALTFKQMPRSVIDPSLEVPYLCDLPTRVSLIKEIGIDIVQSIDFDEQVRNTPARRFMSSLKKNCNMQLLVMGRNARVGNDQIGFHEISEIGKELGFEIEALPDIRSGDQTVSSSAIREALHKGNVRSAATMLGRLYELGGLVEAGTGQASGLIAPTANMPLNESLVMPALGTYATWARLPDGRILPSATYIGDSPTFGRGARSFETHVLGIEEDLYGKSVSVMFVEFVRPDEKFENAELLGEQLKRDVQRVEKLLADEDSPPS